MDLYQLLRRDSEATARLESYGLDPVRVEEWLSDRTPTYADPTASEAIFRADKALAKRRRAGR